MQHKKFDLNERLIQLAVNIIKITGSLPNTNAGSHIGKQILRSGTSPAANYGEAQGAESRKDFIHKMKVLLKELRETKVWLEIIKRAGLFRKSEDIDELIKEMDELISIFVVSLKTANKNLKIKGEAE